MSEPIKTTELAISDLLKRTTQRTYSIAGDTAVTSTPQTTSPVDDFVTKLFDKVEVKYPSIKQKPDNFVGPTSTAQRQNIPEQSFQVERVNLPQVLLNNPDALVKDSELGTEDYIKISDIFANNKTFNEKIKPNLTTKSVYQDVNYDPESKVDFLVGIDKNNLNQIGSIVPTKTAIWGANDKSTNAISSFAEKNGYKINNTRNYILPNIADFEKATTEVLKNNFSYDNIRSVLPSNGIDNPIEFSKNMLAQSNFDPSQYDVASKANNVLYDSLTGQAKRVANNQYQYQKRYGEISDNVNLFNFAGRAADIALLTAGNVTDNVNNYLSIGTDNPNTLWQRTALVSKMTGSFFNSALQDLSGAIIQSVNNPLAVATTGVKAGTSAILGNDLADIATKGIQENLNKSDKAVFDANQKLINSATKSFSEGFNRDPNANIFTKWQSGLLQNVIDGNLTATGIRAEPSLKQVEQNFGDAGAKAGESLYVAGEIGKVMGKVIFSSQPVKNIPVAVGDLNFNINTRKQYEDTGKNIGQYIGRIAGEAEKLGADILISQGIGTAASNLKYVNQALKYIGPYALVQASTVDYSKNPDTAFKSFLQNYTSGRIEEFIDHKIAGKYYEGLSSWLGKIGTGKEKSKVLSQLVDLKNTDELSKSITQFADMRSNPAKYRFINGISEGLAETVNSIVADTVADNLVSGRVKAPDIQNVEDNLAFGLAFGFIPGLLRSNGPIRDNLLSDIQNNSKQTFHATINGGVEQIAQTIDTINNNFKTRNINDSVKDSSFFKQQIFDKLNISSDSANVNVKTTVSFAPSMASLVEASKGKTSLQKLTEAVSYTNPSNPNYGLNTSIFTVNLETDQGEIARQVLFASYDPNRGIVINNLDDITKESSFDRAKRLIDATDKFVELSSSDIVGQSTYDKIKNATAFATWLNFDGTPVYAYQDAKKNWITPNGIFVNPDLNNPQTQFTQLDKQAFYDVTGFNGLANDILNAVKPYNLNYKDLVDKFNLAGADGILEQLAVPLKAESYFNKNSYNINDNKLDNYLSKISEVISDPTEQTAYKYGADIINNLPVEYKNKSIQEIINFISKELTDNTSKINTKLLNTLADPVLSEQLNLNYALETYKKYNEQIEPNTVINPLTDKQIKPDEFKEIKSLSKPIQSSELRQAFDLVKKTVKKQKILGVKTITKLKDSILAASEKLIINNLSSLESLGIDTNSEEFLNFIQTIDNQKDIQDGLLSEIERRDEIKKVFDKYGISFYLNNTVEIDKIKRSDVALQELNALGVGVFEDINDTIDNYKKLQENIVNYRELNYLIEAQTIGLASLLNPNIKKAFDRISSKVNDNTKLDPKVEKLFKLSKITYDQFQYLSKAQTDSIQSEIDTKSSTPTPAEITDNQNQISKEGQSIYKTRIFSDSEESKLINLTELDKQNIREIAKKITGQENLVRFVKEITSNPQSFGRYYNGIIEIADNKYDPEKATIYHETAHYALDLYKNTYATQNKVKDLLSETQKMVEKAKPNNLTSEEYLKAKWGEMSLQDLLEEELVESFAIYAKNKDARKGFSGFVKTYFDKLLSFVQRLTKQQDKLKLWYDDLLSGSLPGLQVQQIIESKEKFRNTSSQNQTDPLIIDLATLDEIDFQEKISSDNLRKNGINYETIKSLIDYRDSEIISVIDDYSLQNKINSIVKVLPDNTNLQKIQDFLNYSRDNKFKTDITSLDKLADSYGGQFFNNTFIYYKDIPESIQNNKDKIKLFFDNPNLKPLGNMWDALAAANYSKDFFADSVARGQLMKAFDDILSKAKNLSQFSQELQTTEQYAKYIQRKQNSAVQGFISLNSTHDGEMIFISNVLNLDNPEGYGITGKEWIDYYNQNLNNPAFNKKDLLYSAIRTLDSNLLGFRDFVSHDYVPDYYKPVNMSQFSDNGIYGKAIKGFIAEVDSLFSKGEPAQEKIDDLISRIQSTSRSLSNSILFSENRSKDVKTQEQKRKILLDKIQDVKDYQFLLRSIYQKTLSLMDLNVISKPHPIFGDNYVPKIGYSPLEYGDNELYNDYDSQELAAFYQSTQLANNNTYDKVTSNLRKTGFKIMGTEKYTDSLINNYLNNYERSISTSLVEVPYYNTMIDIKRSLDKIVNATERGAGNTQISYLNAVKESVDSWLKLRKNQIFGEVFSLLNTVTRKFERGVTLSSPFSMATAQLLSTVSLSKVPMFAELGFEGDIIAKSIAASAMLNIVNPFDFVSKPNTKQQLTENQKLIKEAFEQRQAFSSTDIKRSTIKLKADLLQKVNPKSFLDSTFRKFYSSWGFLVSGLLGFSNDRINVGTAYQTLALLNFADKKNVRMSLEEKKNFIDRAFTIINGQNIKGLEGNTNMLTRSMPFLKIGLQTSPMLRLAGIGKVLSLVDDTYKLFFGNKANQEFEANLNGWIVKYNGAAKGRDNARDLAAGYLNFGTMVTSGIVVGLGIQLFRDITAGKLLQGEDERKEFMKQPIQYIYDKYIFNTNFVSNLSDQLLGFPIIGLSTSKSPFETLGQVGSDFVTFLNSKSTSFETNSAKVVDGAVKLIGLGLFYRIAQATLYKIPTKEFDLYDAIFGTTATKVADSDKDGKADPLALFLYTLVGSKNAPSPYTSDTNSVLDAISGDKVSQELLLQYGGTNENYKQILTQDLVLKGILTEEEIQRYSKSDQKDQLATKLQAINNELANYGNDNLLLKELSARKIKDLKDQFGEDKVKEAFDKLIIKESDLGAYKITVKNDGAIKYDNGLNTTEAQAKLADSIKNQISSNLGGGSSARSFVPKGSGSIMPKPRKIPQAAKLKVAPLKVAKTPKLKASGSVKVSNNGNGLGSNNLGGLGLKRIATKKVATDTSLQGKLTKGKTIKAVAIRPVVLKSVSAKPKIQIKTSKLLKK